MKRINDLDKLMFPVELRQIYVDHTDSKEETKSIEVKNRRAVVNTESGSVLGVVHKNYRLISNAQAVELGKQCCMQCFGATETKNFEIFQAHAPSSASYCHIDLVHTNHVLNPWREERQSDAYIPYVRVTNSYNTSRALRFDVGFCRAICSNGVIFGSQTVRFKFSHTKQELDTGISFSRHNVKMQVLFDRFADYARRLRTYRIPRDDCFRLILILFEIKKASEIDFRAKKENEWEHEGLLNVINSRLAKYLKETGENAYSVFNTITDLASRPIERNRYFRRDMNSMQRLAGNWMNAFQKEIKNPNFNIANYLNTLENDRDKTMHQTSNRYITQTQLSE